MTRQDWTTGPWDPTGPWDRAPAARGRGLNRVVSVAALALIGIGVLISLAPDLSQDELRFEHYLERSIDRDVLEVASLAEEDFSRDRIVGLLISSTP